MNISIQDILLITLANNTVTSQQKISNLYEQMKKNLVQLDQADSSLKNSTQKMYLKAFMSVMERMSVELLEAKRKYERLDREGLKNQKCGKLAQDIRVFREECYMAKTKLQQTMQAIKREKQRQDLLKRQQQALKVSLIKMKASKKQTKSEYARMKSFIQQQQNSTQNYHLQKQSKNIFKSLKNTKQNITKTEKIKKTLELKQKSQVQYGTDLSQDVKPKLKVRPKSTTNYYRKRVEF